MRAEEGEGEGGGQMKIKNNVKKDENWENKKKGGRREE